MSRHPKKIKIKIKTARQIKSRIWEMKGGKYTKTLAKIWVEGVIRIRDIRGNVLPKFIELCMETPCRSSSGWAQTWRTETNRKRRLWKPKQWRLNRILLAKVVLSRYFWPTRAIDSEPIQARGIIGKYSIVLLDRLCQHHLIQLNATAPTPWWDV